MLSTEGDRILLEVRNYYRRGYKTADKIYVGRGAVAHAKRQLRATNQGLAHRLISDGLVVGRNCLVADAYDMATLAAEMVGTSGSTAHIGIVSPPNGRRHAFCVAGYAPNARSPMCVREMSKEVCQSAWVIDPWMNVSCSFQNYPTQAEMKFTRWSQQGKHIVTQQFGVLQTYEDPGANDFQERFFRNDQLLFLDGSMLIKELSHIREEEERQLREAEANLLVAAAKALPIFGPL